MRVGPEGHLPGRRHQVEETRLSGELAAEDEGVDEKADQPFDLSVGAVGDRCSHQQVQLPRDPRQQGLEGGEEDHERGRRLPPAEPPESGPEPGRKLEGDLPAAIARERRPGPVGGQLETDRGSGQALLPPGDLPVENRPRKPLPLPDRKIRVLNGEGRQGHRLARTEGAIGGGELAYEDPHRPAVGDDVVESEEGDAILPPEPDQGGPEERPGGEVEGPARLLDGEAASCGFPDPAVEARKVDLRQRGCERRADPLRRSSVDPVS